MRARNIKPGFFVSDQLLECDPLARILFLGLACICDRDGRFEWRPKKHKIEILPCDNCDIGGLIEQLVRAKLVNHYEAGGREYGEIPSFLRHQNPHKNEKPSTIPPGPESEPRTYKVPCSHHTSTVQVPDKYTTNPAESLNPESLNPESLKDTDVSLVEESTSTPMRPEVVISKCPHQKILNLWAEVLPELTQPVDWDSGDTDGKYLATRWREKPERQTLGWWQSFFTQIRANDFLMGLAEPTPKYPKPFRLRLAWLVKKENWKKTVEWLQRSGQDIGATPAWKERGYSTEQEWVDSNFTEYVQWKEGKLSA
jgi:hypothetical protein